MFSLETEIELGLRDRLSFEPQSGLSNQDSWRGRKGLELCLATGGCLLHLFLVLELSPTATATVTTCNIRAIP